VTFKGKLPECPYTVNERWAFLDMAAEKAEESKCNRSKVGVALVGPGGKFIHVACNEVAPGHGNHTCKDFCPRGAKSYDELPTGSEPFSDCNSLHAEFVAINLVLRTTSNLDADEAFDLMADGNDVEDSEGALREFFKGWWMFGTKEPCDACKMYLQGLGIRYQFATSWKRRVVREGVLVVAKGKGSGKPGGSANDAN
jgi:deoxycytidylate deaminase